MTTVSNKKLLTDQIKGLKAITNQMADNDVLQSNTKSFLADSITLLSELQTQQPQAYEQVERLALYLTSIANGIGHYYASAMHEENEKAGESRQQHNSLRQVYALIAESKAAGFWEADADRKEYRLTEVAREVHEIMLRENFSSKNAAGKETITPSVVRAWIKPTAPDYASLPGRKT